MVQNGGVFYLTDDKVRKAPVGDDVLTLDGMNRLILGKSNSSLKFEENLANSPMTRHELQRMGTLASVPSGAFNAIPTRNQGAANSFAFTDPTNGDAFLRFNRYQLPILGDALPLATMQTALVAALVVIPCDLTDPTGKKRTIWKFANDLGIDDLPLFNIFFGENPDGTQTVYGTSINFGQIPTHLATNEIGTTAVIATPPAATQINVASSTAYGLLFDQKGKVFTEWNSGSIKIPDSQKAFVNEGGPTARIIQPPVLTREVYVPLVVTK